MKHQLRALIVLFALALASTAAVARDTVPAWVVGTFTSEAGETKDVFLRRVGHALTDWADTTATEACGRIGKLPDGRLSVLITTQKAQTVCVISDTVAAGQTDTKETIHIHPGDGRTSIQLTTYDRQTFRALHQFRYAEARVLDAEPIGFSQDDYEGGPGYLIAGGRLLYQHGKDTSQDLGAL